MKISCRIVLTKLLFLFFVSATTFCVQAKETSRPNLLIITADDLNGDSWFNSKVGATPNLDAFAKTCYRFEQMHVSAPICQPSRSALMTGRVPHRNGALGFGPINLDVPTLTEVLGSNGYFTAAINKVSHMAPRSKFNWDLALNSSGKNPTLMREQVAQCLKTAAEKKKPFFINANMTDPHRPFVGSERESKRKGLSKNEEASAPAKMFTESEVVVPSFLEDIPNVRKEVAQYFSSVRRLDENISNLLAALKTSGQENNTVIVFMSDHGMSFPFSKATLYRNGTTSPLLIRWPGIKKPFVNKNDFISSVDVMPTVLELLKVEKPAGMDGRSFQSILEGKTQPNRDHVFTHVNTVSSGKAFPGRCVRSKTRAYMFNSWPDGKTQFGVEAMAGLSYQAMAGAAKSDVKIKARVDQFILRSVEEFYDEEKDPDERRNLIADPAYQKEIQKIRRLLLEQMEKTGDPLLPQFRKVLESAAS